MSIDSWSSIWYFTNTKSSEVRSSPLDHFIPSRRYSVKVMKSSLSSYALAWSASIDPSKFMRSGYWLRSGESAKSFHGWLALANTSMVPP